METEVLAAASGAEYSMWSLFWRATFIVKAVMIMLFVASVMVWAVWLQKVVQFRAARRRAAAFDRAFWSGDPLDELYDKIGETPRSASERIFSAAMSEWNRSHRDDGGLIAGAQARIDRTMDVAIAKERDRLTSGLTFLATVGSVGPFVGLFGTVWGIMHAFQEIAIQQNTNLAVVAPGIAEALLATGLGLLAAIPAVIFYNKLTRDADRITGNYEAFADEFATILSRQLDAA
ncbi:protein TolQ [Jannaschia aquimarina]|uniref:Tol-Pal system protein TolQ n=1 Tax=Jannaschia aquimarina TaxID=935700 RepID=A0A0D1D387_9RHOB|nr:protein TolQ [Jannaschia aquimarina]KIT14583.1 Biopolymer transport protein ExbB [Jannaschia aquimarina]SNT34888.1 Cell division and transport-associated protein TolQ [Jannaschia aquimarina]